MRKQFFKYCFILSALYSSSEYKIKLKSKQFQIKEQDISIYINQKLFRFSQFVIANTSIHFLNLFENLDLYCIYRFVTMIKGKFIVVIYFLISLSNCGMNCGKTMFFFQFYNLLYFFIILAHSQHEIIQRVVGGFEIDIKAVPYEVSLQENGSHSCGGSIINEEWILSAAHCTE